MVIRESVVRLIRADTTPQLNGGIRGQAEDLAACAQPIFETVEFHLRARRRDAGVQSGYGRVRWNASYQKRSIG